MVLAGVLLYIVLHAGFRLLASSTLGEDDTLDQILVQDLRVGYDPRQPPLYDWLLWLVQQVTGPRLVSFLAIKYAALAATAVLLYLVAFRVLRDRLWAVLTVESLALIYQISWRYHEGFTHQVLAMVAVAATLWAVLRLIDRGRTSDFILLGFICGLSFLTEPAYAVYLASLLAAAFIDRAIRDRVLRPALAVTAVIALVMVTPFAAYVLTDPQNVAALWRSSDRGHLMDVVIGIKDAVRGPLMYLSPLIVILPIVFPGFLRTAWADIAALRHPLHQQHEPDLQRFVLLAFVIAVALSLAGAILLGIGNYPMHALMPLYVTSVVWLFSVAKRSRRGGELAGRFTRVALTIAVIALFARLANMFVLDPVCGKCRWGIPYAALATEMRSAGFRPDGTIVAMSNELAGNMRQHFPLARIVTRRDPDFTPKGADPRQGSVAFIWDASDPAARVDKVLGDLMRPDGRAGDAKLFKAPWRHLWKPTGYRTSDWRILVLDRARN
ncbi:MAG: glycosyltransferase family 39 protein [Hyphomicrobiaceae bacterium]